jgi:hypothetical protein
MAAGLGFKTFAVGEILSAANVNGYLMQGVLVFANATARDAAITSPQEGQFAFTKDNDSLWYYSGSAWVASGATGDIEGVTAGVGISGGGTSGTVTVTNAMATEIAAKGDLIVGTGSQTFDNLTVGTNGHTLVADSSTATGLKWAAPAGGGGKVLQVVSATTTTSTNITSTSYTDTTITATITPTSATSKILVLISAQNLAYWSSTNTVVQIKAQLLRDATQILEDLIFSQLEVGSIASAYKGNSSSISYLDNPSTTSSTTYKLQAARVLGNGIYFQGSNSNASTITLLEIGA